jgi:hypothetical protein
MSSPKSHRHIHGASGLKFDLVELRKHYANCVRFEHLPELQARRDFYESILDEVDGKNYESLYNSAAKTVSRGITEIDRLQRAIFENIPLEKAVEIIDDAPMAHGRMIIRDKDAIKLKQELEVAREARDKLVAQKQNEFVVQWAYRITSAQGSVDQAKKALYMHLRANRKNSMIPGGHNVKHKDL